MPWKILIPLYSQGLWDAEIITAASYSYFFTRYATAGVGISPKSITSAPTEQRPAEIADSSICEEARVSIPIRTLGLLLVCCVSTIAAALPIFIASSQVSSELATPLAPSVPKSLPIINHSIKI